MSGDSEHIELLRCGPRPWNEWREQHPSVVPNLDGISLSIGDRQLGPINGGPINLAFARLRHAFLRFATLTAANLEGADLADADLRDARLEGANLAGADLSDALLDRADLAGANLAGANLCAASLAEVRNLTQAQLYEAEGNAHTVLPSHLQRPHIWTVAEVVKGTRPASRGTARPVEPEEEEERPPAGERISWFIGGPRPGARAPRVDAPAGEPGNV